MITKEQSLGIKKKLIEEGKTVTSLSKEFGVSRTFLAGVINGSRKSTMLEEKLQVLYKLLALRYLHFLLILTYIEWQSVLDI